MPILIPSNKIYNIASHNKIIENKINAVQCVATLCETEQDEVYNNTISVYKFNSEKSYTETSYYEINLGSNTFLTQYKIYNKGEGYNRVRCQFDAKSPAGVILAVHNNSSFPDLLQQIAINIDSEFYSYTWKQNLSTNEETIEFVNTSGLKTGHNLGVIEFWQDFEPAVSKVIDTYDKYDYYYGFESFGDRIRVYLDFIITDYTDRNPVVIKEENYHKLEAIYCKNINLRIISNVLKKTPTDKQIGAVNDNSNPVFSFQQNNLFQISINSGKQIFNSEILFNDIINKYKNGRENAVIKVALSDYYNIDESNNQTLAISQIKDNLPMIFKLGDIVRPYTVSLTGEVPLSIKIKNNIEKPKDFIVVGSKIINDGNITQELTLIEKI